MADLYWDDVVVWSERQAELLRRLAAGERVNDAIDWPNVIEEVESVGRSETAACESLFLQALVHLLKLRDAQGSESARHWRGEVIAFLTQARRRFTPSMRQKIDLDDIWKDALNQVESGNAAVPCPLPLDALLTRPVDIDSLLAALGGGKPAEQP